MELVIEVDDPRALDVRGLLERHLAVCREAIVQAFSGRGRGAQPVSLETGTMASFGPARSLYTSAGFRPCEPFGDYTPNPYSMCMTIDLAG